MLIKTRRRTTTPSYPIRSIAVAHPSSITFCVCSFFSHRNFAWPERVLLHPSCDVFHCYHIWAILSAPKCVAANNDTANHTLTHNVPRNWSKCGGFIHTIHPIPAIRIDVSWWRVALLSSSRLYALCVLPPPFYMFPAPPHIFWWCMFRGKCSMKLCLCCMVAVCVDIFSGPHNRMISLNPFIISIQPARTYRDTYRTRCKRREH